MTIGIDLVHIVDPQALDRARRLDFAVHQVQSGTKRRQLITLVRARFGCSYWTAWRVVDMAFDLAAPTP